MQEVPMKLRIVILAATLAVPAAFAQSPQTAHTLQLDEGAKPPAAALADVAWIAGHWRGGVGSVVFEEVWSPPFGGSMMGMCRIVKGGAVSMYEILTIVEEEGSLVLRMKHFNADLKGWEEKDVTVDFPLVKAEPGKAYFAGMTFLRRGPDEIAVYVADHQNDGSVAELEFVYRRFDGS